MYALRVCARDSLMGCPLRLSGGFQDIYTHLYNIRISLTSRLASRSTLTSITGEIVDPQGVVVPDPNLSNPCTAAKAASYKCVEKGGNCQDFFDAYKACKKNWYDSKAEYRKLKAKVDRKSLFAGLFQ